MSLDTREGQLQCLQETVSNFQIRQKQFAVDTRALYIPKIRYSNSQKIPYGQNPMVMNVPLHVLYDHNALLLQVKKTLK